MAERAEYHFAVKEHEGGQPWIMVGPMRSKSNISVFKRGFLGFDLPDGVSYEDAQQLAETLDEKIKNVTYTAI